MKKKPIVKVKFENVPSHTITGFFGGLNPNEGIISFFQDQLIPREGDNPGEIVLDSIEQKFLINIRMNPIVFKRLAHWMTNHIKRHEEQFGEIPIGAEKHDRDIRPPPYYG
ncbi:MAG: DUF3467 domain-containing protein [Promethearchaeota archaeon]